MVAMRSSISAAGRSHSPQSRWARLPPAYKHTVEVIKFGTRKMIELHQVAGSKAYDLITDRSGYKPISPATIRECLCT